MHFDPGAGMTNRDMERERERREWEQSELQELDDLQAKHARIDERLEVKVQLCSGFRTVAGHPSICRNVPILLSIASIEASGLGYGQLYWSSGPAG